MAIKIEGYNPLWSTTRVAPGRITPEAERPVQQGGDRVTISEAAHAAYRGETTSHEEGRRVLRERIESDPEFAGKMARSAAYGTDLLAIDPNSLRLGQTPRYRDGTPASDRLYREQMQGLIEKVRERRIAYYEEERARGTTPRALYEKIEAFNRALPEPYRRAVGYPF